MSPKVLVDYLPHCEIKLTRHIKTVTYLHLDMAEASCTQVDSGSGNNPLLCASYSIPKGVGSSVTVGLQTLSIGRTSPPTVTQENGSVFYSMTNNVNYVVHFIVQYYDAKINMNAWRTFILEPGEACNVGFPSTLQNVKLTC
ncbi:hypothetical protein CORC01_02255 [Colletotrichum orchidophilum]|uniref:Uncharacterized protein n=1 Tax=Colletotrichum orchidophilum TaxID=1209926 RepID=A0A1G4BM68_9PEZI|nr:uncharacterized protein CORC01_02255 [Colletotrichum orchidophilum]OHF02560.1 hypothetical protein CORC01_02255 [Colletotrichum orchidophilum]